MIDTATNTVVASVPVGNSTIGVTITPDGAFAYMTSPLAGNVLVIDTATNTLTATIKVGSLPTFIAFARPDPLSSLIAQVETLIAEGSLTQNQGDGLIDKLNEAAAKLDAGEIGAACNQLSSFINQVQAFINSSALTQAQGQSLIDGANAIRIDLDCR